MCRCPKKRLSLGQKRDYLNCLRTLQAEGICVDIPDEWLEHSRALDVVLALPPISVAFDWPSGGAGYAIWLRLLSRKRCMVEECALAVPWEESVIIQTIDERKLQCDFGPLVFSLDEVLNYRIENTLRFPCAGHVVQGVILGRGAAQIPIQYASFAPVPFTLTLYDQYGDEVIEQGHLSVGDRARKRTKPNGRPTKDLFGNPRDGSTNVGTEVPEENTALLNPRSSVQPATGQKSRDRREESGSLGHEYNDRLPSP